MIIINGLLPDLKKEEQDKKAKNEPIVSFTYDNTLEETDTAMKMFQKNYSSKRGIMFTIAYLLIMAGGIAAIVFNPTNVIFYLAVAFCLLGLIYHLTAKYRIRKSIIKTLSKMNPEDYHCTLYKNKIEIETIIKPKETETAEDPDKTDISEEKNNDESGEKTEEKQKEPTPIKTVFKFNDDLLDFSEDKISLYLVYNRQQIYCFPKRCLSEDVQNTVREHLTKMTQREWTV